MNPGEELKSGGQGPELSGAESPQSLPYADTTTPRPRQVAAHGAVLRGDVAVVALRVLAIYIILNGLSSIVLLADELSTFVSRLSLHRLLRVLLLPSLLWLIVQEAIGVLLFVGAARLCEWMLPKQAAQPAVVAGGAASSEWQSAAFAVIGVVLAVLAAPDILFALWQSRYQSMLAVRPPQFENLMLLLFKPLVQLGLGIWLFFGSRKLALVWRKMRSSDRL